ncbi:MAG: redoxin domain-containing protein, partial [Actinomycetota bacterium]
MQLGDLVPDFELSNQHGEKIKLSSYRGKKNVVIVFYPAAFTGTCTGELCALRDDLAAFNNEKI